MSTSTKIDLKKDGPTYTVTMEGLTKSEVAILRNMLMSHDTLFRMAFQLRDAINTLWDKGSF